MENVEKFCNFLREYTDFIETVALQEKDRLDALLSGEIEKIEQTIAQEQVVEKKLQLFETQRIELQKENNASALTFSQIINTFEEPLKGNMQKVLLRMQAAADNAKFYNTKSLEYAKMNLQRMHLLEKTDGTESGYTQDKKATSTLDDTSLFNAKI
ncbi:MAG: hypothetical protein RR052_00125 [Oscillospiraceae bacterium]